MDSKLPIDTLGKIWDLADVDKDGMLDRHEFMVVRTAVDFILFIPCICWLSIVCLNYCRVTSAMQVSS
jgi:hypothetical protein